MKLIKKITLATFALGMSVTSMFAQEKWPEKINFGVIPTAGSTSMKENFSGLTEHLNKKLGIKVELQLAGDYTGVITGMQHKHIDVAYFGPKSYVEAQKRANAEASVVEVDAETGFPGYKGIIITKKDSGLNSLESIKGKTWAFTSSQSTSGTLVPMVMFSKAGINPQEYFSKVLYSGGHEASILSIKAGKIDAASTNDLDFNRGLGKAWNAEDFNIIWTSDLIPGSPMAVRGDLPKSLKKALKEAFISYNDKEGLNKLKIKGYIEANDSMYNPIRDLIEVKKQLETKK
uniref:phosphonate ABC transporter substrate-binding protein n=1 Tax=Aliarcobacter sp. TaxID=2321116 RepID=UPI004047A8CB